MIDKLQIGSGRWEVAKFNERHQVTEMSLGTSPTDTSLWKINYDYGETDSNGNVDLNKNTGSVARQTVSFAGITQPFVQTYRYDSLYRINEARETQGAQQTWKQSWEYDRFGNRMQFASFAGTTQLVNDNKSFPQIDPATNRFNPNQGYLYDKNGNLIANADGLSVVFNGENKQSLVLDQNNQPIGRYFYDGEGRRVKKVTDLETTVFVYDASSKLIAEYSNQTPENPNTSYVATDTLLSVRLVTDKSGNVVSRRDFKPFGEELPSDGSVRKTTDQYSTATEDKVRQRFTGYQKDIETGLDFAEARMYENRHGRFTAVDPLLVSGTMLNPQSFNRFLYVQNDPINLIDPSGLACENADRRGDERCIWVAKGNSYGSMWESRFKGGNDLFDAGFTIVENPEAVDPFFLEAVHDTDEGPLNSVDEEYQTMIGMKVVLGINGRFEVRDAKALRDEDGMFGFLGATQDSFRDRLLYGSCNEGQGSCGEQLFNQDLLPDSVELNGGFLGASLGTKLTRNGTWFGQGGGDFIGSVANPLTLVKIAQNGRITPSISLMFNKTLRFGRMSPETRNNVESGFTVGIGGGSGLGGQVLYVPSTGDVVVGAGLTTPGIWVGGGYAAPFKRRLFSW